MLIVDSLVKSFGGLLAIDNLSFQVKKGVIHAVIGPNGAGKTTLISQLSGEIKPDSGTVFGPVIGAVAFLFLEEFLSGITEYWQIFFGPMLVLIAIFGQGGIDGILVRLDKWWQIKKSA